MWRQLLREGVTIAKCTVERLMKAMGLAGVRRGKSCVTTVPDRNNHRIFGPSGYLTPAEAEANYHAPQKQLDMAA